MITRIALAFVLVASVSACKSKQAAKTTPPPAPGNMQPESTGSAPAPDSADDKTQTRKTGDPCDGGEAAPKKKDH